MNDNKLRAYVQKALPWTIGAGIAISHIAMSSNCSLPKNGHCSTCGSCIIALATLAGWAMFKKREDFFISNN
jgi:hypothetical protein